MMDAQARAREHEASLPTVSVIIPTFNDAERLATCLRLLSQQDYPTELFDVIVVDNASTEDLRPALPDDLRFQLVHEGKRGSYAARNAGVEVATGEVLAFTDSDCLPRHDWLSEGVRALLATPPPDAIGGPITMVFQDGKAARSAPELYDSMEGFPQERFIQVYPFAATANMMVRRDTFNAVGPFNNELASGGDREWGVRLASTGRTFAYAPGAVVDHPSRATWRELTRKSVRVGKGMAELNRVEPARVVFDVLKIEARGTWRIWREVWGQAVPPGRWPKMKYATAFSYVHAIRSAIGVQHFVQRELRTRRKEKSHAGGKEYHEAAAAPPANWDAEFTLSVVIPAYNAADTIGEQLAALADQEFDSPFEIIVSDNGSTDETADVVRSWTETLPHLRLVDASARKGPAAARNMGVAHVASPFILFCDADDVVGDDWLSIMYDTLQENAFVVGRTEGQRLNPTGSATLTWTQDSYLVHWVWPEMRAAASNNMAIHRSVFEEVGGFEEAMKTSEDVDLSWRVQLAGYPLKYQPEAVLHVRKRSGIRNVAKQYFAYGRGDKHLRYRYAQVLSAFEATRQLSEDPAQPADPTAAIEPLRARQDQARATIIKVRRMANAVRLKGWRRVVIDRTQRYSSALGNKMGRLDRNVPQLSPPEQFVIRE